MYKTTIMFTFNEENCKILTKAMEMVEFPNNYQHQVPPPTFKELRGEFLNYIERKELFTKFWVNKKFSNPQGTVQGGMIAACFDDTFGPLGMVTARNLVMSIDMNIQYIRAVPLEQDIFIHTKIITHSPTTLFIRADAFNARQKLLAQASTNMFIVKK